MNKIYFGLIFMANSPLIRFFTVRICNYRYITAVPSKKLRKNPLEFAPARSNAPTRLSGVAVL